MNPKPGSQPQFRVPAAPSFSVPADSLPHILWLARTDGSVDRWNRRWFEHTGADPVTSTEWAWLEQVEASARADVQRAWTQAVAVRQPFELTIPLWNQQAGGYRPMLVRAQPSRDLSDAIVGWVGTLTDVPSDGAPPPAPHTEQPDVAESARREVARVAEELQQFAYAASHDLREPVRMITSYLNLLERRYGSTLDRTAAEYVHFAVDGSTQMNRLLDDLLAYSRVVSADPPVLRPVNMSGVIQWVMMNLAKEISETGAKLSYENLPTVNADENRIVLAVQHLISNSLRYRSEAPPEIRVSAEERDTEWLFTVADNGIGFDQQYAERIFGAFKRLHGKHYPGTGMGLAVVRKIIERHRGRIWAESAPHQGARFYFTLPL